jgi:periplasmic nitrate reductase NapD
MNISGVVVCVPPEQLGDIQEQLAKLTGVVLHAVQDDGRMVITIEDTPENQPADILMRVQNLKGILSASLIYNYCDDEHQEKEDV